MVSSISVISHTLALPITICGFFASINDWVIISIPPTTTAKEKKLRINLLNQYTIAETIFLPFTYLNYEKPFLPHLIPIDAPKASNCSDI